MRFVTGAVLVVALALTGGSAAAKPVKAPQPPPDEMTRLEHVSTTHSRVQESDSGVWCRKTDRFDLYQNNASGIVYEWHSIKIKCPHQIATAYATQTPYEG